jgi:hypothetical protein
VPTFATREERSPDLALEPAQVRAVAAGRVYSTITADLDDGTVALIDGRFDPAIGSASPSTAAGAGCGQFIFPCVDWPADSNIDTTPPEAAYRWTSVEDCWVHVLRVYRL